MTNYEIEAASAAFERALDTGAPGLSETMRKAVVSHAVRRLRHQFNVPAPTIFPPIEPDLLSPSVGKQR